MEKFAEKVNVSLKFDIPYRELAFQGTPFREMVVVQPSVDCLVNLTEVPAFVVSLSEIEHVHFERVTFQVLNRIVRRLPCSSLVSPLISCAFPECCQCCRTSYYSLDHSPF